jgi:hypothetical protein
MDITINDIITTGRQMNEKITQKIDELNKNNDEFYERLSNRLTNILNSISNFKETNLKGLTDTKNQLDIVKTELDTTKRELEQAKLALEKVTTDLNNSQTELLNATSTIRDLEKQVKDLNKTIEMMDTEYINKIETIKQEMNENAAQQQKDIQTEYDNKSAALEDDRNNLLKQIEQAKGSEQLAIENLTNLKRDQDKLIQELAAIKELLVNQIVSIDTIKTDQPNINSYSELLDNIEQGLNGVMSGINQAVANTSVIQPVANTSVTPYNADENYNKLRNLIPIYPDPNKLLKYLTDTIDLRKLNTTEKSTLSMVSSPQNKPYIIRILNDYKLNIPNISGGRRRRRTMKKRPKKTRKLRKRQKGGYTYSASKELDKASSVVSNSSSSTDNSGSKTKTIRSKKKSRRRSRK